MKHERKILSALLIVLNSAFPQGLWADESQQKPNEIGATTSALFELQRSGSAAGKLQPVNGDVASRSYQRYLDGFTQPLPDPKETAAASARPSAPRSR